MCDMICVSVRDYLVGPAKQETRGYTVAAAAVSSPNVGQVLTRGQLGGDRGHHGVSENSGGELHHWMRQWDWGRRCDETDF